MLRAELSHTILDAAGHMALDEAVHLHSPPEETVLRFYDWDGPACTFGYSQLYSVALGQCRARGWNDISPVRRATGGGIVFHDGDLTFSLVFPWDKLCAAGEIYQKIHRGIHVALKSSGVLTDLWPVENRSRGLSPSCFVRAEPMDLVGMDGRKILGGALRKKAGKGLYQGSLRPESLRLTLDGLRSAVFQGVSRGFGRAPATEIKPAWREAGRGLEPRYRGSDWNERR